MSDQHEPLRGAFSGLDLSLCERDPIHIPGAIQPHGALIAARLNGLLVSHASANLAAILGRPADSMLGRPLQDAIGEAACRILLQAALLNEYGVPLLLVLMVLRPLATGACLGSGAPGGLFTPTMSFGALLGGDARPRLGADLAGRADGKLRPAWKWGGSGGDHARADFSYRAAS